MALKTTGISGLDAQLGGGIPPGSTLLLIGDPGNASSVFCEQFAGGGLNEGEDILYYDFDRPCAGIRAQVTGFVHNGNAKKSKLKVFDGYSTQFGKGTIARGDEGTVSLLPRQDAFTSVLKELSERTGERPYRLVIESVSSLVTRDNHADVLEFVKRLVYLGQELNGVQVITLVKGLHDPVFETHLKHLSGGVLELGTERKGFGIYSYLLITKMRNLPDPIRLVLFKETDKGLWLESTKRVF